MSTKSCSDAAYKQLLQDVAPCSLLCYTCPGYRNGVIPACAETLHHYLTGHSDFLKSVLTPEQMPIAEEFDKFNLKLQKYSKGKCAGCRSGANSKCSIQGCGILACVKSREIDFCAECKEFPCEKVQLGVFSETVLARWLRGNRRIREVGVQAFFEEERQLSHYIDYEKQHVEKG